MRVAAWLQLIPCADEPCRADNGIAVAKEIPCCANPKALSNIDDKVIGGLESFKTYLVSVPFLPNEALEAYLIRAQ